MGLFDFIKINKAGKINHEKGMNNTGNGICVQDNDVRNSIDSYVDGSTIPLEERQYYRPDNYYTYYSYPGTNMSSKVITFEERKTKSYPSARGLYVAEILLLEYCTHGDYPSPKNGYPGLWWFEYGIRDVGRALKTLETRGFLKWAPKAIGLEHMKVADLKQILVNAGLPDKGKKAELIERIASEVSDDQLFLSEYKPKYELTELGEKELEDNGYVPYMHKHADKTTEDARFGETFNVWSINKLFPDGDATNWRNVVGSIEKKRFGVDLANGLLKYEQTKHENIDYTQQRDSMRKYINDRRSEIQKWVNSSGDGYDEEAKGLRLMSIGEDRDALFYFYVSIGKRFDAPALYVNAAKLLQKYAMYEEELHVIDLGLHIAQCNEWTKKEMENLKATANNLNESNK